MKAEWRFRPGNCYELPISNGLEIYIWPDKGWHWSASYIGLSGFAPTKEAAQSAAIAAVRAQCMEILEALP